LGSISTKSLNTYEGDIYLFNQTNNAKVNVIKLISVNLPESYLKVLEILVSECKFPNRSEAIRVAIRDLIKTEYLIEESIEKNIPPSSIEPEVENEVQEKLFA
jgi:Arc/MetJ-type ribon-helix-helix transcriptional regulator